jgi:hypothetical protein
MHLLARNWLQKLRSTAVPAESRSSAGTIFVGRGTQVIQSEFIFTFTSFPL